MEASSHCCACEFMHDMSSEVLVPELLGSWNMMLAVDADGDGKKMHTKQHVVNYLAIFTNARSVK